jgi:hypothetical protein
MLPYIRNVRGGGAILPLVPLVSYNLTLFLKHLFAPVTKKCVNVLVISLFFVSVSFSCSVFRLPVC